MPKNNYVLAEEPAADLAVLEAFVDELEAYIVNDELYRTVRVHLPTGDQMIQMSGGDLPGKARHQLAMAIKFIVRRHNVLSHLFHSSE